MGVRADVSPSQITMTGGKALRQYSKLQQVNSSENYSHTAHEAFQEIGSISARIMLDSAPLACSLWGEDGTFIDCNQAMLNLYQLDTKEEFIKNIDSLNPECQPDGAKSKDRLNKLKNYAIKSGHVRINWTRLTKQGEELPVEMTLVGVPWLGGKGLAVFERDLRERIAAEKRIRNADRRKTELEIKTRSAQAAYEEKNKFLSSISHEIKTPMNAIISLSDLMRTDNLDQTQRSYFEDIKKISRQLLQLMNDVLDFSRIEEGNMELKSCHFNMLEVFDHISSMSRFLAETKKLSFFYSFDPEVPHVIYGDDIRLRQVLLNIINNAIKYTRVGYVDFCVKKVIENDEPYIVFSIRDTGIGIRKRDIPNLFSAFQQFDKSANNDMAGAGLGLIISDKLVKLMGGRITVESKYGAGSVFTVWIPLKEGDPTLIEYSPLTELHIATDDTMALVIDDNAINLKVNVAYLARHNIKAETALSGAEALKLLKKNEYDIVFLDHMMPDMDGIETVKRIRKLKGSKFKEIPIIALTANIASGLRNAFIEAGMSDYITKPIESSALNKIIERWLPREKMGGIKVEENSSGKKAGHEILDISAGLKNAAENRELYEQLVINFIELHADDKKLIEAAFSEGDVQTACRIAHTLKSNAALLGAERLRRAAFALEAALRSKKCENADILLGILDVEMIAALEALDDVTPVKVFERITSVQNMPIINSKNPINKHKVVSKTRALHIISDDVENQTIIGDDADFPKDNSSSSQYSHTTKVDQSVRDFIYKLKSLLIENNTESLELLDDIREYLGPLGEESVDLVAFIWDFEFESALNVLISLEESLE